MKARVVVTLKSGVLDPQGKAIEGALASLGIEGVASVRQGKVFDVEIEAADPEAVLKAACERLLANTVVENYRVELEGAPASASAPGTPAAEPPGPPPPPPRRLGLPLPPPLPVESDPTELAAKDAEMPTEGHP